MAYTANKAAFRVEPAAWDARRKQYILTLDGEPVGVVSTLTAARRFVRTSREEDRRVYKALARMS